jgi:hypothetical protein
MAEIDHVLLLRQGADAGMLGVRGSRRSTRRPATIAGEIVVGDCREQRGYSRIYNPRAATFGPCTEHCASQLMCATIS